MTGLHPAAGTKPTAAHSIAAATAALVLAALPLHLTGGLAVLMADELSIGIRDVGAAVSLYFGMSALSAVPAGMILRRFGVGIAVRAAVIVTIAGLAAIGLVARDWTTILVALAFSGMGAAVIQVGTNVMLAKQVPATRQGIAFGVKMAAIPGAAILAGMAIPLIGLTIGWRMAFLGGAAVGLGVLVLMPRSSDLPGTTARRPEAAGRRELLVVAVGAGIGSAAGTSITPFLVSYLVAVGHAPAFAGLALAAGSVTGACARIALGWSADRVRIGALHLAAAALALGAIGCLALAVVPHGASLGIGILLAFGGGFGWAGLVVLAVARARPGGPASALAMVQAATFSGAIVGPYVIGQVAGSASYSAAWAIMAVALLTASTILWLSRGLSEQVTPVVPPANAWEVPGT